MSDLKCPAWIGTLTLKVGDPLQVYTKIHLDDENVDFDWLCDRPAEYSINGTVLCQFHALSVQNGSVWRKWFDDLQPTHENKREVTE